jgi:hypothetical protein
MLRASGGSGSGIGLLRYGGSERSTRLDRNGTTDAVEMGFDLGALDTSGLDLCIDILDSMFPSLGPIQGTTGRYLATRVKGGGGGVGGFILIAVLVAPRSEDRGALGGVGERVG